MILREQFVERISCSRPSLVCASSPPLAYSSRTAKERKGTFSFHVRRFIGCGKSVHSLLTKRRECVVNRRLRLVNAHEERMREPCYARCGDQELRLSTNRREAGRRNSVTGQLRVMVLDASPTSRKILEVILHREGHQVVCFDDSLEALRFLSRHGAADLLFLGLELPKMDGFKVLQYLRGEPRFHLMGTIALLNERDGILVRLKARLAGAQQVVTKPLVRQRIVALVSEYPY